MVYLVFWLTYSFVWDGGEFVVLIGVPGVFMAFIFIGMVFGMVYLLDEIVHFVFWTFYMVFSSQKWGLCFIIFRKSRPAENNTLQLKALGRRNFNEMMFSFENLKLFVHEFRFHGSFFYYFLSFFSENLSSFAPQTKVKTLPQKKGTFNTRTLI